MTRSIPLFFFLIIGLFPGAHAAGWSESTGFSGFPGLQFRWRNESVVQTAGMNFIEFEFTNSSEAELRFFYVIGTDSGEFAYGRIDLGTNETRLLGWLFTSSSIVFVEATDPDSAAGLLEEMGLGEYRPEVVP